MKVDIKEVLRGKSPALARVPFLVRYLRRIIHEEEINSHLENFSHLDSIGFIHESLAQMQISYSAVGMEKLDPNGRYIFASNHPFGGLDGLMLADTVSEYFGDARVVVNDLLMHVAPLRQIFIPINKHGRQSGEYSKLYNDAFASAMPIITFPAGLCSRRVKGQVRDSEWKPSFIKQAVASERDIVPVYFDGCLSNFFYRLSNLRTRLGVKANIEMLYLADEMFKQRGRHFDIMIGDPVPWQSLSAGGKQAKESAQGIRTLAYNLKKNG